MTATLTHLQRSVAQAMAKLQDPEYVRVSGLRSAFANAETTGRIGGEVHPVCKKWCGLA